MATFSISACSDPGGGDGPLSEPPDAPPDAPGEPGPPVADLPASLDLGDVDCGGTARATFQLANTGASQLMFDFSASDPQLVVSPRFGGLAPGAALSVQVTALVPAEVDAGAALTAMLVVATNAGAPSVISVAMKTRGAQLVLDPPMLGFGQVAVGFPSARPFEVRNVGNAPATVSIAAPGGELTAMLGGSGAAVLAPGDAASGEARYLPVNLGNDTTGATLAVSGPTCGRRPGQLGLAGTGVVGDGVMVQGGPIDFGVVGCDAGGQSSTITLVNPASISVPFDARFAIDPDLDHLRFSVTPSSGSVPASGSIVLQVRRNPLPAPATPRVHDAVLRIGTLLGVHTVTEVPVRDEVQSAALQVSASARDFGFSLPDEVRTLPLRITNTGNALASLKASGPFEVLLPMPLAPGASADALVRYAPTATTSTTPVSGPVAVSAVNGCQAPQALTFQGGIGPYAEVLDRTVVLPLHCPAPSHMAATLAVRNRGNRPLRITCRETVPSALELQVAPFALSVEASSTSSFAMSLATGDIHVPSVVSTSLDCVDNEPITNVRRALVTREIRFEPASICFE
jgi:hypothetical protein